MSIGATALHEHTHAEQRQTNFLIGRAAKLSSPLVHLLPCAAFLHTENPWRAFI
jgi:hypothetical protein